LKNKINLKINVEGVFLNIDTAIPCSLIINELVSNSIKHAFPDGREGEIRIEMHSIDNSRFKLIISDSGIGFPEHLDFRNTQSLGLQLVMNLINQLDGNIELYRDGGTTFEITFAEVGEDSQ
jgi:two-component sensor histidine kinase